MNSKILITGCSGFIGFHLAKKFCDENNITTLWGVGGEYKSNSSSKILKRWQEEN